MSATRGLVTLKDAEAISQRLMSKLEGVSHYKVCGSTRRQRTSVNDIDIVLVLNDKHKFSSSLVRETKQVLRHGNTLISIVDFHDVQIDFLITTAKHYGAAILHYTGSKQFNIRCRTEAKNHGLLLNEKGLWSGQKLLSASERQILSLLGKQEYLDPITRS